MLDLKETWKGTGKKDGVGTDVRVKGKRRSASDFASAWISLCRRSRFFYFYFLFVFTMVVRNSWGSAYHSCLIPQGTKGRCFQDDWLM